MGVAVLPSDPGGRQQLAANTAETFTPGVKCAVAQFFLDADQLIVFRKPVRACERAGLDLTAVRRNRQIGDRRIFGFTRPVRHDRCITGTVCNAYCVERFRERADLVDLHQQRIRKTLIDPFAKALGVRDEQIVADQLHGVADPVGQGLPALEIVLPYRLLSNGWDNPGTACRDIRPAHDRRATGSRRKFRTCRP